MGALPNVFVVAGPQRDLEPRLLHRMFEQQNPDDQPQSNNDNRASCPSSSTALIVPAVGLDDQHISFAQLNTTANRYARTMLRLIAAEPGRRRSTNPDGDWIVAVCMPHSDHLIAVLLAVWKIGAAYLPVDVAFPRQRIEHIVAEAQPVLCVVSAEGAQRFDGIDHSRFEQLHADALSPIDDDNLRETAILPLDTAEGAAIDERLAVVLYTSGSTGIPKGVRLTHACIHNRLRWQWDAFPFDRTERTCVFKTALTFVDSIAEIWAPLLSGRTLLILSAATVRDPERLVDALEAHGIQRLVLVPTLLRTLLMYLPVRGSTDALRSLRLWVCSGETLTARLANEFYAQFGRRAKAVLCNFYGSTEIMGDVTYYEVPDAGAGDTEAGVPIGYPISNTIVYVLGEDMRPTKPGATGELYVAGRNLAAGYVGGRDRFRFVANPLTDDPAYARMYRTGDYASVRTDDGALRYDGRTDSQVKIRGYRVDLAEVERQLLLVGSGSADGPRIDKGLVLCHRPGELDQALVAFVTVRDDADSTATATIERELRCRLTEYMVPQVMVVEAIPLLVNGKVDRQTLLRVFAEAKRTAVTSNGGPVAFDYAGVRPEQMLQARALFETVGAAIGGGAAHRRAISVRANFYELGGNSLNSIYTVTQLCTMGYRIGVQEFISAVTLGDILEAMTSTKANGDQRTCDRNNNSETMRFELEPLDQRHKNEVIELMTQSFFEKADLERLLKPHIVYQDYERIFVDLYDEVCAQGVSFVVRDAQCGRIVGASLNTDAHDERPLPISSQLSVVFDFLHEIQHTVRVLHPTSDVGQLFHAGMMGTSVRLSAQENIAAMHCMEAEVLRVARSAGYAGVFTTNTSPLTQQLASYVHGYETVCSVQVNRWRDADGRRPFAGAPDEQMAMVQWKGLE